MSFLALGAERSRLALERRLLRFLPERWHEAPDVVSSRLPSVWGTRIEEWLTTSVPRHQQRVTPEDDVQAAIQRAVDAIGAPGANPLTHRARITLAPGLYRQALTFAPAWGTNIAIELVGEAPGVVIDPAEDLAALEHAAISCLLTRITFRKSTGTAWAVHGAGRGGIAREMIVHDCSIEALNGAAAFSHENAAAHTLYMSQVRVRGGVYQHTIRDRAPVATLAIWDDCDAAIDSFADESVNSGDTLLIRSGRQAVDTFAVKFQRTGSPLRPRLSAVIDPASGITRTNSRRVRFATPDIESHPILDRNPVMLAAYS